MKLFSSLTFNWKFSFLSLCQTLMFSSLLSNYWEDKRKQKKNTNAIQILINTIHYCLWNIILSQGKVHRSSAWVVCLSIAVGGRIKADRTAGEGLTSTFWKSAQFCSPSCSYWQDRIQHLLQERELKKQKTPNPEKTVCFLPGITTLASSTVR